MLHNNNFPEDLIKGRIAETIFELMFREINDFDIYPLGYEHTLPALIQYRDHPSQLHKEIITKVLDNFDDIPDFMLVKPDKSELYLVEVKYRQEYSPVDILQIAKEIDKKWHPVKLFLATSEKFYYTSCKEIIVHEGNMEPLKETQIPTTKQTYYHDLLMRFEK